MARTQASGDTALATTPAIRLGVHLKQAQHLLRQRMDERLRPLGLNAGLWSVLHEMVRAPGASSAELARSAFQTPQTVGGLIKRLTQLGLVERHQAHGRVVENHLTEHGNLVYQQATEDIDTLINSVLVDLTATNRNRLDTLLVSLVATLGG
ncbi:MAG TPA: MarR family transcriptional regulator [Pseudonocardiaceae bacterium]|jgi:DNA-binding MarR family transcriptional regulator